MTHGEKTGCPEVLKCESESKNPGLLSAGVSEALSQVGLAAHTVVGDIPQSL